MLRFLALLLVCLVGRPAPPSPLWITQRGQPGLEFTAHGDRGWLFDFTHHKVYLTDPPPEVQKRDPPVSAHHRLLPELRRAGIGYQHQPSAAHAEVAAP